MNLSIITPCYFEEKNLQYLWEVLQPKINALGIEWEWIIIDDGSGDKTWEEIKKLSSQSDRIKGIRFSQNHGPNAALSVGMEYAEGDWITKIPADLQEPPELIVKEWENREGVEIVWGVREKHPGGSSKAFLSALYYQMVRLLVFHQFPKKTADSFLISRQAARWMLETGKDQAPIFGRLLELGLPSREVCFEKKDRLYGVSGWTLRKKIRLVLDTLVSFSCRPLRVIGLIGLSLIALGITIITLTGLAMVLANFQPGFWAGLLILVSLLGGLQMSLTGFLGEYVWRTLDAIYRSHPYHIKEYTGNVEKQNP